MPRINSPDQIDFIDVRNPQWADANNVYLTCEVNFSHLPEDWVEFACCSADNCSDQEPWYVSVIFEKCANGDYGTIAAYEEPENLNGALSILMGEEL